MWVPDAQGHPQRTLVGGPKGFLEVPRPGSPDELGPPARWSCHSSHFLVCGLMCLPPSQLCCVETRATISVCHPVRGVGWSSRVAAEPGLHVPACPESGWSIRPVLSSGMGAAVTSASPLAQPVRRALSSAPLVPMCLLIPNPLRLEVVGPPHGGSPFLNP